jgi:hypothetical protein
MKNMVCILESPFGLIFDRSYLQGSEQKELSRAHNDKTGPLNKQSFSNTMPWLNFW